MPEKYRNLKRNKTTDRLYESWGHLNKAVSYGKELDFDPLTHAWIGEALSVSKAARKLYGYKKGYDKEGFKGILKKYSSDALTSLLPSPTMDLVSLSKGFGKVEEKRILKDLKRKEKTGGMNSRPYRLSYK